MGIFYRLAQMGYSFAEEPRILEKLAHLSEASCILELLSQHRLALVFGKGDELAAGLTGDGVLDELG